MQCFPLNLELASSPSLTSFKSLRLHGLDFITCSNYSEAWWDHNFTKYIPVPKIKQLLKTFELPHYCFWKGIFLSQMQTSCWGVSEGSELGRQTQLKPFSSPLPFLIQPPPPQICWSCHLRQIQNNTDKFKVCSGTWARKDNKTHILTKVLCQTWVYCLAHSRHPTEFRERKREGRGGEEKGREKGREEER